MEEKIITLINNYIDSRNGKIYAPIPHPLFKNIEAIHDGRSDIIVKYILESNEKITNGIDIGSHWGEMCYTLEDIGIKMTAIESYIDAYNVLLALKKDCNRNFDTIYGNILEMSSIKYDIVMALNIFHHFIKTKEKYEKFIKMLSIIDCKIMFFQSHNINEGQMLNSYKNFTPDQFINIIIENSCLNEYKLILNGSRPIYMLIK